MEGTGKAGLEHGGFLLFLALISLAALLVVLPFWGPLLWATLAAIMFQPLHRWFLARRLGKDSQAAGLTLLVIFIAVIGGIGRLEGPILGVLVFWGLQTAFADYGSWYLLALGLLAIATMLFAPRGLWGLIHDRTGLSLFPVQRRLVTQPSD